jgi:hypothetical protein
VAEYPDRPMVCRDCGETPHRYAPSPDAGPFWRCSECGEITAPWVAGAQVNPPKCDLISSLLEAVRAVGHPVFLQIMPDGCVLVRRTAAHVDGEGHLLIGSAATDEAVVAAVREVTRG